jgi:hypothetical protein
MTSSSIFMGLLGLSLTFMPNEVIETLGQVSVKTSTLILQLTGALYFGFALTNWMAKGILIGGIYARPLAIGNFSHFLIAGIALVKFSLHDSNPPACVYILAILYTLFAISFGLVLLRHPIKDTK